MKRLILICGANGVGKSTASKALLRMLPHSAYVESDSCRMTNPDDLRPALVQMQYRNLLALIGNALACPEVSNVIFPYGFHGHRKALFEQLWEEITRGFPDTRLIPLLLCCSPEENVRRAKADGRDHERIERGMKNSRNAYEGMDWPCIDVTRLTPDETAQEILRRLQLAETGISTGKV